jgi:hypothetical protein
VFSLVPAVQAPTLPLRTHCQIRALLSRNHAPPPSGYLKAIEGPIVDGVGLGYPGFFALPGQVRVVGCVWDACVGQQ